MSGLSSILIPAAAGALGVVIAVFVQWYFAERTRKKWLVFLRKEKIYSHMLELMRGFYTETYNQEQIDRFTAMIKISWLYAPDDVIKKTYEFTDTVNNQKDVTSLEQKHRAAENFVAALRKDLMSNKISRRTKLNPEDFQHIRASNNLKNK